MSDARLEVDISEEQLKTAIVQFKLRQEVDTTEMYVAALYRYVCMFLKDTSNIYEYTRLDIRQNTDLL